MPKGPLGGPRPLSEYRIIIDPHEKRVDVYKVGPLGFPRPFAKNNPPVGDDKVAECMMSEAGRSFGAGVVTRGATTDISDLNPEGQQKALELAEKWCEGSKEAQAIEKMKRGQALPTLSRIRRTLSDLTGEEDDISIEMIGNAEDVAEELEGLQPADFE